MKRPIISEMHEALITNCEEKYAYIQEYRAAEIANQLRMIISHDNKDITDLNIDLVDILKELPFITFFFKGPYFTFISKEVGMQLLFGKEKAFAPIDWSLSFDSNVANKILGYCKGINIDQSSKIRVISLLKIIHKYNANFDFSPFVIENIRLAREDASNLRPFDTIAAFKAINYIDWKKFDQNPDIPSFTISWEKIYEKAETTYQFYLNNKYNDVLKNLEEKVLLHNAFLLEMTRLWLLNRHEKEKIFTELLDFCIFELKLLPYFELKIAWDFLQNPGKIRFFGPIFGKKKTIIKDIKGMAWDIQHIRIMETMATLTTKGSFYLPCFVSFDNKFSELLKSYPVNILLIDDIEKRVQSIRENELEFQEFIFNRASIKAKAELTLEKSLKRIKKPINQKKLTSIIKKEEMIVEKILCLETNKCKNEIENLCDCKKQNFLFKILKKLLKI